MMKIKNLTSKTQKVVAEELTAESKQYDFYLAPYGETNLENMIVSNPEVLSGIIEILDETTHEEHQTVEEEILTEVVETKEDVIEEPEVSDKFICELCGSEFASARGLSSHMSRVHKQ